MTDTEFMTLGQVVKKAHENLSDKAWDALVCGAEAETTLKRNRFSLDSLGFRPRVARDMAKVDMTTTLFGQKLRIPVMLAPVGSLKALHDGGSLACARAAEAFGTIQFLSSASLRDYNVDQVRAAANGPLIFQLYIRGSDDWAVETLQHAVDIGYMGICFTLDSVVAAQRERELSYGYDRRKNRHNTDEGNFGMSLTWKLIKRVRETFKLPFILKGIATAEDALLAVEHGIDAVYVSNHGGRAMDHGRAGIDILPEVVKAVDGRIPVIVDSGFCRGSDVIKALCLGADAVCIGKLQGFGLAAGGKEGVVRVLELLEAEMRSNMRLLGVSSLAGLNPSYLQPVTPMEVPSVVSAFPQYDIPLRKY
jgi:isopentenyl diphosphate isomerase/L-lactate dehydrogenase-like FMN-dependent dehydrogenase